MEQLPIVPRGVRLGSVSVAADPATRLRRGVLSAFGLALLALAWLMHRAGLSIDPAARGNLPFYLCGAVAMTLFVAARTYRFRHVRAIGDGAEYVTLLTLMTLAGAVASYPVSALTHGYHDAALQRIDTALGFDWLAWYGLVAAHPALQVLGIAAYRSIYVTPAALMLYYAATGRRLEAYRFQATFLLAATTTLALFAMMPAVGPFAYLWHGPFPYMPESELWQPNLIPELRSHLAPVVDLGALRGLVSAPSFHTVAAVLYIVSAWNIRLLRWPVTVVNVAMLVSTPVEGTHYLTDMLLGGVVAIAAVMIMRRVTPATR